MSIPPETLYIFHIRIRLFIPSSIVLLLCQKFCSSLRWILIFFGLRSRKYFPYTTYLTQLIRILFMNRFEWNLVCLCYQVKFKICGKQNFDITIVGDVVARSWSEKWQKFILLESIRNGLKLEMNVKSAIRNFHPNGNTGLRFCSKILTKIFCWIDQKLWPETWKFETRNFHPHQMATLDINIFSEISIKKLFFLLKFRKTKCFMPFTLVQHFSKLSPLKQKL